MTDTNSATPAQPLWARPIIATSVAIAVLAVGYTDLARGGLTLSAALLTLGYVIFVPAAIMAVPARQRTAYRRPPQK